MGLDVGDKTIGVALSDPMFLIANPLETIKRKKASLDMKVMSFVDLLKKQTDKEIIYQDERMTTIQSERVLIDMDVRRENRKKHIDKIAASFILQTYLDGRRNG